LKENPLKVVEFLIDFLANLVELLMKEFSSEKPLRLVAVLAM